MTTILCVRKEQEVVMAGDGQVSMSSTIMKPSARKIRRTFNDKVIAGFAGSTADAFTLFEKFDEKLEQYNGKLVRSAVELAKEWRTDKMLRNLEALLAVSNEEASLIREASSLETASSASRLRSILSVRHSFASSTAERTSFPLYCSSFSSNFSKSVNASAVDPAKPAITLSLKVLLILRAEGFMMVLDIETWPSPAMTTSCSFRTQRMVVIYCLKLRWIESLDTV